MSKALIYAVNTEAPTIAEGGSVPVGTVIHRFGCALRKAGNTIQAIGKGYFEGDGIRDDSADSGRNGDNHGDERRSGHTGSSRQGDGGDSRGQCSSVVPVRIP